jgi:phytoene dehydrogenase-like protein
MSMAKGARMHGARFYENVRVHSVLTKNGGVVGVKLENGYPTHLI